MSQSSSYQLFKTYYNIIWIGDTTPKLDIEKIEAKNIEKGPENIINPEVFMAITIDDISLKFNKLIELSIKNQNTLSSILEHTIENEKRLGVIQDQLLAEADNGQFLRTSGTVTTTSFTIIDTNVAPGHMVKGYTVKNDGPNNIFVGHNVAISSDVDADIVDVTTLTSRFDEILPNEDIKFIYNRRTIRNVHILASGNNSQFRCWLVW